LLRILYSYLFLGDDSLEVKKINLSQLSSAHDYQDLVVCIDLDMRGQKLMSREVDILSSLTMKQQVRSIALKSGPIDSEDLSMILQAVLWKSDVRCLSLHNCRLNSEALQSALDKNHNTLSDKAVIGSEKDKKQKSSSNIENNQAEQRLVNDKLILLDLSFNSFDNKSFKALSAMMKKCSKLQILSLDGNKMHVRDVQLLFECVRGHPSITHISLSDCGLTDDCLDQISFALKMNRSVSFTVSNPVLFYYVSFCSFLYYFFLFSIFHSPILLCSVLFFNEC
jgi:hypothetical protein